MTRDLRNDLIQATMILFNEKGLKFTMDDLAKQLQISKKTIYTVVKDKESLLQEMVDYCFDEIKQSEAAVLKREDLDTISRLKALLAAMPETFAKLDLSQLYVLEDRFPKVYMHVRERLEGGWEPTIKLIEEGIEEGVIRPISIPVFKTMMEASLETFFKRDILIKNHLTYQQGLNEVVDILINGIIVKE